MIEWKEGENIFLTRADSIVNTVNTVGVMGKGLALIFKKKYPEMYNDYRKKCLEGKVRIGNLDIYKNNRPIIINFPTKIHWRGKSRIEFVERGLDKFIEIYKDYKIKSVAFPPLGCGHGGLLWSDVKTLMENKLGDLSISVEIYFGFDPENPDKLENLIKQTSLEDF